MIVRNNIYYNNNYLYNIAIVDVTLHFLYNTNINTIFFTNSDKILIQYFLQTRILKRTNTTTPHVIN